MAGFTTTMSEFSTSDNSRTFAVSGHTAALPKLVVQKRRVPTGEQVMAEDTVTIVYGAAISEGVILTQKSSISIVVRRPISADSTYLTGAYVVAADLITSDQFGLMMSGQLFLA